MNVVPSSSNASLQKHRCDNLKYLEIWTVYSNGHLSHAISHYRTIIYDAWAMWRAPQHVLSFKLRKHCQIREGNIWNVWYVFHIAVVLPLMHISADPVIRPNYTTSLSAYVTKTLKRTETILHSGYISLVDSTVALYISVTQFAKAFPASVLGVIQGPLPNRKAIKNTTPAVC